MPLILFILAFLLSAPVSGIAQQRPTLHVEVSTDLFPVLYRSFPHDSSRIAALWSTRLELHRVHYTENVPFIPVLYFEPASGRVSPFYRQFSDATEATGFHQAETVIEDVFDQSAFRQKQRDVLNIVGEQMVYDPEMTITLQGAYSTEPGESAALAEKRVTEVRAYLQGVWGVEGNRIKTVPPHPPAPDLPHARARKEARSVRIVLDEGYSRSLEIETRVTRVPGYRLVALKIGLDAGPVVETTRAELVILSGPDTLCRYEIPIGAEGHPVDSMALWSLPYDVRHLDSTLEMQVIVGERDGVERLSNIVQIDIVVGDVGEHADVDRSLKPQREVGEWYEASISLMPRDDGFEEWLGPDKEEMDTERLLVRNFAFGDSTLPFDEEERYASFIDKVVHQIQRYPERRWRLKIVGSADLTEPDFLDPRQVDRLDSMLERTRHHVEGDAFDSAFRTGLYFFAGDFVDNGGFGWGKLLYVFREVVHGRDVGLRGFGLDTVGMISPAILSEVMDHRKAWVQDTGVVRLLRADGMLRRLRRDLPGIEFDTIQIEAGVQPSGSYAPLMPIEHGAGNRAVGVVIYSDATRTWFKEERERNR